MEKSGNALNDFIRLVGEREGVTPMEAAEEIGVQEKEVLDLVRTLESQGMVKTRYSVTGDITLEKGERIAGASGDELESRIKEVLSLQAEIDKSKDTKAAEIIEEIRSRIRAKRHSNTEKK
jgi:Mn-dependent DtxR family transcriptional regulator